MSPSPSGSSPNLRRWHLRHPGVISASNGRAAERGAAGSAGLAAAGRGPGPASMASASRTTALALFSFIFDHLIILGISILILIIFGIMAAVFSAVGVDFLSATSVIAGIIGFFAIYFVYFPYFWTKDGQTLGMRPFHLRVVMDRDGGTVTLGPAILRLIGYWIERSSSTWASSGSSSTAAAVGGTTSSPARSSSKRVDGATCSGADLARGRRR